MVQWKSPHEYSSAYIGMVGVSGSCAGEPLSPLFMTQTETVKHIKGSEDPALSRAVFFYSDGLALHRGRVMPGYLAMKLLVMESLYPVVIEQRLYL